MKKNTLRRTERNLAICFIMALVGVLLLYAGNTLFDFRMEGGYSVPENKFLVVVAAMGIVLLENIPLVLGFALLVLGVVGIYNNTKILEK